MATFSDNLKTALKAAAKANNKDGVELDSAVEEIAAAIADEVKAQIEAATITIPSGAVVVAGSATTQTNASPVVVSGGITLANG